MDEFLTVAGRAIAETRVRGSTFRALAAPAESEDGARAVLAEVEREYFDATHHCSAWRLHGGVRRANDAGEPSGSAGAPILAAIEGAELVDCVVVVTRYFGGTKLGVGGLVRAYGEAAALALEAAPRRRGVLSLRASVRYPYEHTSAVMRALERVGAHEVEHGFTAGGAAGEVSFTLPRDSEAELREILRDQTSGAIEPELLGERVLYTPPRA